MLGDQFFLFLFSIVKVFLVYLELTCPSVGVLPSITQRSD